MTEIETAIYRILENNLSHSAKKDPALAVREVSGMQRLISGDTEAWLERNLGKGYGDNLEAILTVSALLITLPENVVTYNKFLNCVVLEPFAVKPIVAAGSLGVPEIDPLVSSLRNELLNSTRVFKTKSVTIHYDYSENAEDLEGNPLPPLCLTVCVAGGNREILEAYAGIIVDITVSVFECGWALVEKSAVLATNDADYEDVLTIDFEFEKHERKLI